MTKQVWPFLPHLVAIGALWQTTLDNVELYHSKFKLKKDSAVCWCITYYMCIEMHGGCGGVYIGARVCCHIFLNFGVTEFTLMRMLEMPISFRATFFPAVRNFFLPLSLSSICTFCFPAVWLNLACVFFVLLFYKLIPFSSLSCRNFLISKSVLFCVCKLIAARIFLRLPSQNANHVFFPSRYGWP